MSLNQSLTHNRQPGRKSRRRNARLTKAAAVAPRPVDKLKPIVRCPSIKYNRRVRAGRGFSLAELKVLHHQPPIRTPDHSPASNSNIQQEASIPRHLAPTIGISVDPRRRNLSTESLALNVSRLKAYRERLILFPRRSGQRKGADSSKEDISKFEKEKAAKHVHGVLPIKNLRREEAVTEVSRDEMPEGEEGAYRRLREARSEARLVGVREKRAKAKAEEAAATKK